MKKTLLLTSLIAVATMAATTGSVKGFAETEANFNTTFKPSTDKKKIEGTTTKDFKVGKIGVETEVKVKDTGFSFGGTFQAKDIKLDNTSKKDNFLDNSKVWVKYELPEMKGINSYVKATISPKLSKTPLEGDAKLEGQVDYKINKDVKVGLNSKTTFPFKKSDTKVNLLNADGTKVEENKDVNYGYGVESTHKLFVEAFTTSKENKRENEKIVDAKAHIALTHSYGISENVAKEENANGVPNKYDKVNKSIKSVSLHGEAVIRPMKDVEIKPIANFVAQINGEMNINDNLLGNGIVVDTLKGNEKMKKDVEDTLKLGHYLTAVEANVKYTGVKDTEINVKPFVDHVNFNLGKKDISLNAVYYGAKVDVKYTGLVKDLTLTGRTVLSGLTISQKEDKEDAEKTNMGVLSFGAGAKYDYKVTDKFIVSPEANADLNVLTFAKDKDDRITVTDLTIAPKVSAEYKPAESLTVKGSVEVPIKFGMIANYKLSSSNEYENDTDKPLKFGYKSTSIKGALNVEYKW